MVLCRAHRSPPNARLTTNHAGVNFWQFWVLSASHNGRRATRRNTESLAKPSSGAKRIREVYSNSYSISYFSYSWDKGDPWMRVWGTVVSGRRRLTGRRFLRDRLSLLKDPQVMKVRRVAGSDAFANKFLDATAEEVAVLRKAGSLPILMDGLPINAEFHGSSP